jgi:hypothetical protein
MSNLKRIAVMLIVAVATLGAAAGPALAHNIGGG